MRPYNVERQPQILEIVFFVMTFDSDIVDIKFHDFVQIIIEDGSHGMLISRPEVLQANGYDGIAVHPLQCVEQCVFSLSGYILI